MKSINQSINQSNGLNYRLSTFKKCTFLMFFFVNSFVVWSQNQYSYYLVEEIGTSIEPQSITTNSNGTLNLSFTNSTLNSFFQGKTVFKYEKAFPNENSAYLQRVYKVVLNNSNYLSSILNLDNVEYAELEKEGEELLEPNDPYYVNDNLYTVGNLNKTQINLIRANKAWDITTGNPNIILGIVDNYFDSTHEDLQGKFNQIIDNNPSYRRHGTLVAGIAAANTNNSIGIAAVGHKIKVIGMANGLSASQVLALSNISGVRVINASWHNGTCNYSPLEQEIFKAVWDKGIFVVAAAGNGGTCNGPNTYVYPAAYDYVFAVSSVGHANNIGYSHPTYGSYGWRDVHQNNIDPLNPEESTHQHNDKVDIVAPGYNIFTTNYANSTESSSCTSDYCQTWGTSLSSPTVAGAAGLLLSVNPNLTPSQLENILKSTADDIYWIPYNQPYIGKLGSGRLNVFRAVKTAECMDVTNPKVELVVRDSNEDIGNEPNTQSPYFWKSEDIWVRNQDDGRYNETHQSVEYDPSDPNHVYVRITNYGCQTSSGEDELNLYWSYSGTSQSWPNGWDGTTISGGQIGTQTIPELGPGQEAILEFEWYPPDPATAPAPVSLSGNFSLLARIISDDDPISYTNGSNINTYVGRNNNVAWKNINVIDMAGTPKTSASFMVSNTTENTQTYSLELQEENPATNKSLYEEAEIGIVMDSILYDKWTTGGSSISHADDTKDPNVKRVNGETPKLDNITLAPGESGMVEFTFNFLTKELIEKNSYEYNLIQKDNNDEIVGGATIQINKENRNDVIADVETSTNSNSTTLVAENIGESAVYNWYDSEGNLIYSGTELTVSPEITKTYKLEIISDLDGFKDYKEVEVIGNSPYSLGTMVPNPASSQVTISYDASSATSAYLIITNTITTGSENHILNTSNNQVSVNLSSYPSGIYMVTLVCNGAIVDSKSLIKN